MVHCGCAAATVLVACLSGATAMPDNDGRPYWKELMSAESPAPALHTLPDRQLNKQRSLATGAERARVRGKFKVTGELCAHLVSIWRVMRIPCEQLASHAHTWRVTGELCE